MNKKIRSNSGVTLAVLVITIIVMIIIITVSVNVGKDIIKKSKVQTLETNMLTIQAKAKSYAEEIEAKVWAYSGSEKDTKRNAKFEEKKMWCVEQADISHFLDYVSNDEIQEDPVAYWVKSGSGEALEVMGLDDIKDEQYIVIFSKINYKQMDVIYPEGVTYGGNSYYTLSALQKKLENE